MVGHKIWIQEYEAKYRVLRGLRVGSPERGSAETILCMMAGQLRLHYQESGDVYREAMWQRRAWLYAHGRSGEVYDGTDAVRWKQAHESGRQFPASSRFVPRSTVATATDAFVAGESAS